MSKLLHDPPQANGQKNKYWDSNSILSIRRSDRMANLDESV